MIQFIKKLFSRTKTPVMYKKYTINDRPLTPEMKSLIKVNQRLLLDNNIPIKKVRFVFTPLFQYDIDADEINPKYDVLLSPNILLPPIYIDKPQNMVEVRVSNYYTENNYEKIRELVKSSNTGIVIYLSEKELEDEVFYGHRFGVDSETIRLVDLDRIFSLNTNTKTNGKY